METSYFRLFAFWSLLGPISKLARERRARTFLKKMRIREGDSILDLGGHPSFWEKFPVGLELTILNLPGEVQHHNQTHHSIRSIEGDACSVENLKDHSFDIVFSNSVIEHVGGADKQASFAREVRRLGHSYWVQTPSKWFPIEAHTGMPFWFFYPAAIRRRFIERWRRILPGNPWCQGIEQTTVLSRADLRRLFPEASIVVETLFGLPKSYIVYSLGQCPKRKCSEPRSRRLIKSTLQRRDNADEGHGVTYRYREV
jgi:hypothetical protein